MRSHIISWLLLACLNDKLSLSRGVISGVTYTPCTYPWPGTEEFRKCSGYFHVSFLCDPGGILSLTEAEELTTIVETNYTSCLCDRHFCDFLYQEDKLNFGLAIVPMAVGSSAAVRGEFCHKSEMFQSAAAADNQNGIDSQLGQIYADTIRDRWSYPANCKLDVMMVAVSIWTWLNETSLMSNRVFISLSSRASKRLELTKRLDLLKLIRHQNPFSPSGAKSLTDELIRVAQMLTAPAKRPKIEGIPTWALVTFVFCGAFGLLLALIGHLISRKATHTNRNASASAIIACKKTWQAGFAGGMWQDNSNAVSTAF